MLKVELAALVPVSSDLLAAQAFRRLGTVTGGLHLGTGYARNVGNTEFWVRGTVCDSGVTNLVQFVTPGLQARCAPHGLCTQRLDSRGFSGQRGGPDTGVEG